MVREIKEKKEMGGHGFYIGKLIPSCVARAGTTDRVAGLHSLGHGQIGRDHLAGDFRKMF
jgi:hypothetical protein